MKRVLLTGMSGTGKSSVIGELAARGYQAVDADYGYSEHGPDGEWVWQEDRIRHLLSGETANVLFVCGCASNQGKFYDRFDHILLLSAPAETLMERLRTRTNNPFGKHEDERARVLDDLQTVEPLLRRGAGHEIRTDAPLAQVVETVLRIVFP